MEINHERKDFLGLFFFLRDGRNFKVSIKLFPLLVHLLNEWERERGRAKSVFRGKKFFSALKISILALSIALPISETNHFCRLAWRAVKVKCYFNFQTKRMEICFPFLVSSKITPKPFKDSVIVKLSFRTLHKSIFFLSWKRIKKTFYFHSDESLILVFQKDVPENNTDNKIKNIIKKSQRKTKMECVGSTQE